MSNLDLFGTPIPEISKLATISDCERFRYVLRRHWDSYLYSLPVCMLNPSTADHEKDDPTVRELVHFAKLWGYGGLYIVNLCAFRAPQPSAMMAAADPVGPLNARYLREALYYALAHSTPMLAAWGDGGTFRERDTWMCAKAAYHGVDLVCLGITKANNPKHPMSRGRNRIARDQQPVMWRKGRDATMDWAQ
jgi:hypothetical protein